MWYLRAAICLLFCLQPLCSQASFSFSTNCRNAYLTILRYDTTGTQFWLRKEARQNPQNLLPLYLESFNGFVREVVDGTEAGRANFLLKNNERLQTLKKSGDAASPFYRFCMAEIHLHNALLNLRQSSYLPAGTDFKKAYSLLQENEKLFPDFLLTYKSYLPLRAVVGTVPDEYRWFVKIFGFTGSLTQAISKYEALAEVISEDDELAVFEQEWRVTLSYLHLYLMSNSDAGWEQIKLGTHDKSHNPLSAFFYANIALRVHKASEAEAALRPHVSRDDAVPQLYYIMADAMLSRLSDSSRFMMAKFLQNYRGQTRLKDAYLKLGWAYLLKGDTANYHKAMRLVRVKGNTERDEDKQALKEAQQTNPPHIGMLKARLLFDGGYLSRSLVTLREINVSQLPTDALPEYHYRTARTLQELKKRDAAIEEFTKVVNNFTFNGQYYAPASCYQVGRLLEKQKKFTEAKEWYQKVLTYKNHPYKRSFDQQAKAALSRLE